jgi:3-oxoacyl-[acyl-carrier protein] reductase
MSDFLLELSANPQFRKIVQSAGLPVPMPQQLERTSAPYAERPLRHATILVGGALTGAMGGALGRALIEAGADPLVAGHTSAPQTFTDPAEAFGRKVESASDHEGPVDALIFDATEIGRPEDLVQLWELFHPWIKRIARCGRVIVLGRPPADAKNAAAAAAAGGLEGFTRSVAKEIGRRGSTAQLLYVASGAEARVAGPLRFFLSARSAFVTGQPLRIGRAVAGDVPRFERSLAGKVALVTGAARGIGAATARLLAQEGAKVLCLDRPEDDAAVSEVAHAIGGEAVLQDITAGDAAASILAATDGGVDIVVHNAGITRDKTLAKMSEEQWRQAVEVNLAAVVRINEALLGAKAIREGGRIVCLSSVAGIAGNVGQSNYAASKRGLVSYVEHLAAEVASDGITVNAIAPGFIETRLTAVMPVMIREGARRLSALGQGGQPEDVGHAITFLATPGSVGITGGVLRVCGGALVGA